MLFYTASNNMVFVSRTYLWHTDYTEVGKVCTQRLNGCVMVAGVGVGTSSMMKELFYFSCQFNYGMKQ